MMLSMLERRQTFSATDDFWYRPIWMAGSEDGKAVSPEEALALSAWYNGIAIIAGTIASLPLKLYRRDGKAREEVTDDPRNWLVFRRPNPYQTAMEWREMMQGHLLTRGNSFCRILRDHLRRPVTLLPIHPDRVTVEITGSGIVYKVRTSGGGQETYPERDILHMRGLGADGIMGYSVAALARRSLGYALALEGHGSELMGNKARPGGVLQTDQVLRREQKEQLAQSWDQMYSGGGIGRTAVLDAGLAWQQVGFSAEDAQFLESRKFQTTEVARWLNLPPHFLKDLERATFSNIEQQSLEFVTHTVRPWVERWEQRLDLVLLDESERQEFFFKFTLEALLRGDQAARSAFYKALFEMGALSPNDIRSKEDMNPVEGGDQRFVQLNLVPLEDAGMVATQALTEPSAPEPPPAERSLPVEDRAARSATLRLRLRAAHQRVIQEASARLVKREVQDLRRLLDATDDVDEFLRRMERWSEDLPAVVLRTLGPLLYAYMELVAQAAADEVGLENPQERTQGWQRAHVEALAARHTSETVGRLRDTMTEAQGDPWVNARRMLDRWSENRAGEIALREAVTAGAGIAAAVYATMGRGVVWRTTGTENCPYCDMLAGRAVAAGARFVSDGETLRPDGAEPMTVGRNVRHPQIHQGCDCYVEAAT